jgi:hypothetical protein
MLSRGKRYISQRISLRVADCLVAAEPVTLDVRTVEAYRGVEV